MISSACFAPQKPISAARFRGRSTDMLLTSFKRLGKSLALLAAIIWMANVAFARQAEQSPESGATAKGEQTIYIPYDKLKDVFEREGRGVFLPYDQFQKLWQEARSTKNPSTTAIAPVDFILVSAENIATIEKELMVVKATLQVELLQTGWQKIPLRLNDAAILTATVDKELARIIHDPAIGYSLLFQNKETKPSRIQVELEYAKAYEKSPSQNSVSIMAPQAPVNKWLIKIPDTGVKVQVEPMLATTVPSNKTSEDSTAPSGTEVLAFVGIAPNVHIRWVPKSEGATGMAPLAGVQIQHRVTIDEGIVRTNSLLVYTIDRSELPQLAISLPPNQKVINVFDPNVRKWSVEPGKAEQQNAPKLIVELFEPARKTQSLVVELEDAFDAKTQSISSILPFGCLDASRQQGVVAIRIGQGLRAEPTDRKGLMQMDPTELPDPLSKETWTFAYRFTAASYELKLKLEKVQPAIRVEQWVEAFVEPQTLTLELKSTHTIENAGVFQLEFDIPSDFELLKVAGRKVDNGEAAAIDTYRVNEAKNRLLVSLSKRAIGQVGTVLQLRRKINDPNLITPTGVSSALAIPIPRSVGDYVQWLEGMVSVYAPESLRVNPKERTGVRDGIAADLRAEWPSVSNLKTASFSEVLILAHAMEPVSVSLDMERKKPFVSVRQMFETMVEPGALKFNATFFTKVQYSSLASLRLDVPELLSKEIRILTPGIRESIISPPPADLVAGYVAWELVGDTPWLGERTFQLGWQKQLDGLEIGKRVKVPIPRLIPRNTDQSWGQIVLNRKDSIDLQLEEGSSGIRPIDPRFDLMPGTAFPNAAKAFEFQADWSMDIAATRYALEQVKQTNIERGFVRAVVTRSNRIGFHATYRMRNASQRLSLTLPEDVEFDSQPLLINGQSASLERGVANQLYIPLAGNDPTKPILVELRYTIAGNHRAIQLPIFPDAPSVQTVYLGVFLPKERLLLASNGPWTKEFETTAMGWRSEPRCNNDPSSLMNWVREGVSTTRATEFQTDGVMYLYSTLRPEDGPSGALKLTAIADSWWMVFTLAGLIGLGALFLFKSLQAKVVALACLTGIVIAVGAFAPTLASQLLSGPSYFGALLVLVLWGSREVVNQLPSKTAAKVQMPHPSKELAPPEESLPAISSPSNDSQGGNENA